VRCQGKGRKERSTPLRKDAVTALRGWLRERLGGPADPLFPSARGGPLSREMKRGCSPSQDADTSTLALALVLTVTLRVCEN
jgi:integrase